MEIAATAGPLWAMRTALVTAILEAGGECKRLAFIVLLARPPGFPAAQAGAKNQTGIAMRGFIKPTVPQPI
jgi:hypothetical protein